MKKRSLYTRRETEKNRDRGNGRLWSAKRRERSGNGGADNNGRTPGDGIGKFSLKIGRKKGKRFRERIVGAAMWEATRHTLCGRRRIGAFSHFLFVSTAPVIGIGIDDR